MSKKAKHDKKDKKSKKSTRGQVGRKELRQALENARMMRRVFPDVDSLELPDFTLSLSAELVEAAAGARAKKAKRFGLPLGIEMSAQRLVPLYLAVEQDENDRLLRIYAVEGATLAEGPDVHALTIETHLERAGLTALGLAVLKRIVKISSVKSVTVRADELEVTIEPFANWARDRVHSQLVELITAELLHLTTSKLDVHIVGFHPDHDDEPSDLA